MRSLARLLLLVGAAWVGWYLFRSAPRDVTLVYGVRPPGAPAALEVEIRRGEELVRRSELAVPAAGGEVRHPVRLKDGAYAVTWRLAAGAAAWTGRQALDVSEDATVVLSVGP